MISDAVLEEFGNIQKSADLLTGLEENFVPTEDYRLFRKRVFNVLEARESRLKVGLFEQKGAALLGSAGSGKSRIVREVIKEYRALVEATGGHEYGDNILSVVVPGRASIKDTGKVILRALGYPINATRDEDYLFHQIATEMKRNRVAGLHLDEVQDSGRYKTGDSMALFAKRFRNLMQGEHWPVCLILSATDDAKAFINHDATLTRRLKPIEMQEATLEREGCLIYETLSAFSAKVGLVRDDMLADADFLKILIHAGASCFGMMMEICLEAIGEAVNDGDKVLTVEHFAEAYFSRTNCDYELNPFVSPHWQTIETRKAMDRWIADSKAKKQQRRS